MKSLIPLAQDQGRRLAGARSLEGPMRPLDLRRGHTVEIRLVSQIPRPQRRMTIEPGHGLPRLGLVELPARPGAKAGQDAQPRSPGGAEIARLGRAGHDREARGADGGEIVGRPDAVDAQRVEGGRCVPAARREQEGAQDQNMDPLAAA